MLRRILQTVLAEPAVANPPRRVWRDHVVVAAIIIGSVIEAVVRNDLPWPIPSVVVAVAVSIAVYARRSRPLAANALAFGAVNALAIGVQLSSELVAGTYSLVWVLSVPYAAFRWGSGRKMVGAGLIMAVTWIIGVWTDPGTLGDAIGGLMVLVVTGGAGLEVRQLSTRRARTLERVRVAEREQLARELHDTVAHHVSAIAIQAQAGQAVAATRPEAAADALSVIEAEASQTLTEMRAIVSALRDDGDSVDLAPQPGIEDIQRLAADRPNGPRIDVEVVGDLTDLRPSIDTAVFRIAQESITNATRHATGATAIDVSVHADSDSVRLTVLDDGSGTTWNGEPGGYGLVGMKERAKILGGALSAGPSHDGGWRVDAILPRDGAER